MEELSIQEMLSHRAGVALTASQISALLHIPFPHTIGAHTAVTHGNTATAVNRVVAVTGSGHTEVRQSTVANAGNITIS
jgi:hypothetical protein